MSLSTLKGFLGEEVPTYEEFVNIEEKLPSLDFNLIIDGISSLPLYERLGFNKESLSEEEVKLMNSQAKKYDASYKNKLTKSIKNNKIENHEEESKNFESEYKEDEEGVEIFLMYMYNCSENDELVTRLKQNLKFDGPVKDNSLEMHLLDGSKTCTPSKEFSEFLLKTNDGEHDDFVIRETISSQESCSDTSSEETVDTSEYKAKELTSKFQFIDSINTNFLENIINANRPDKFNMISDNSIKKPVLPVQQLFPSESDSENEIDSQKKTPTYKNDETSKEQLQSRGRKGKRSRRKIKQKPNVIEGSSNLKKTNESKVEVLAKPKEKITFPHSQCSMGNCANIKRLDQASTSEKHLVYRLNTCNKPVLAATEQLSNAKDSIQKNAKKTKKKNETSDSSDEDWQDLAEKNLFLRSKNLEQKVSIKK